MFDRLEYSFNQIRRFTGEASYELKTPLSLIRLQAEKLLVSGGLAPAQEEAVQMQLEELARLGRIIEICRVSVEDQGRGVPADQYERIFERFVRLESRRADDKGSGLGLAICRSIIELHRGRIHAESGGNGHGLRVVFEIPTTQIAVSTTNETTRAPVALAAAK